MEDDDPYTDADMVLRDYRALRRLHARAGAIWDAFTRIVQGPKTAGPSYWFGRYGRYQCYSWHDTARPPYRWRSHYEQDGTGAHLVRIDLEAGTMEIGYPGDDAWEPDYSDGTETLPLAWLWDAGWEGRLAAEMAAAYDRSEAAKRESTEQDERAAYDRLRRKFGSD